MIGTLLTDEKGNILSPVSQYQPSNDVRDFTLKIKQDYAVGHRILHQVFREFNDMSLLQRMDVDQRAYNSYVVPKSDDPEEAWRWNGVSSRTHNKVIAIAAHLVAAMLYPNVFAQNDKDEEDKEAANVMRMLIEWNIRNSDYETSFLYVVIAALVNPVAYLHADFVEALQTIKQKSASGKISKIEVADEILSGFHAHVVPADEILISNAYQFDIQRQRFIFRRKFVDYDEAKGVHGKHKNWEFVQPGVKAIFNEEDGTFYDQKDDEIETLVEEATYYNRMEDVQVVFVNGIYMGEVNVNNNPIKHRDNKNRPKYPYAKTGHEPIDEKRFYFYKSAVAKLADDQELEDRVIQMLVDGTFLQTMPALMVSGGENIDSNVIFPGAVTNTPPNTRVDTIGDKGNLGVGYQLLQDIRERQDESSQSPRQAGQGERGQQTAFEVARLEQNARIQLGLFGKMMISMIKDFGELMVDIIIHHQTIGEVEEILGGANRLKFRTFLLPEQIEAGKKVTKKVMIEGGMIGQKMTEEQRLSQSFKIMEEEGGIDGESRIFKVNPILFSKLKFLIIIEPDSLLPKNEAFEKALKLEAYDRMIANPFVDQEAITRDFLVETLAKGESDKYMRKEPLPMPAEAPGTPAGVGGRQSTPLVARTAKKSVLQGLFGSE